MLRRGRVFGTEAGSKALDISVFAEQVLVLGVELKEVDQDTAGVVGDHSGVRFDRNDLYEGLKTVGEGEKTLDSDGGVFDSCRDRCGAGCRGGVGDGDEEDENLVGDDRPLVCEHVDDLV